MQPGNILSVIKTLKGNYSILDIYKPRIPAEDSRCLGEILKTKRMFSIRSRIVSHSVDWSSSKREGLLQYDQKANVALVCKDKAFPLQAWTGPWGSQRLRLQEFLHNRHMKVISLSAQRTGRP